MKKKMMGAVSAAVVITSLLLISCMREPFIPASQRQIDDYSREIFVINSLAETLSVIDADSGNILDADVLTTGMWPNHVLFHREKIYIVNSGDNNITVYDESTFEFVGEIYLGTNSNPWMIIQKPGTDEAYVPCFASAHAALVDLERLTVIDRIEVGRGPEGGVYQDGKVYIGNTEWDYQSYEYKDGTVSVIDDSIGEVIRTITVGKNPQSIIPFPALDEVHVVCTGKNGGPDADDGKIVIINTNTDAVAETIYIGGSPAGAQSCVDYSTGLVYLSGVGGILSYDYSSRDVVYGSDNYILEGTSTDSDFYAGLAVDETARCLYVSYFTGDSIIKLSLDNYSVLKEMEGSDGPQSSFLFTE